MYVGMYVVSIYVICSRPCICMNPTSCITTPSNLPPFPLPSLTLALSHARTHTQAGLQHPLLRCGQRRNPLHLIIAYRRHTTTQTQSHTHARTHARTRARAHTHTRKHERKHDSACDAFATRTHARTQAHADANTIAKRSPFDS